jgi:hypothetical protein
MKDLCALARESLKARWTEGALRRSAPGAAGSTGGGDSTGSAGGPLSDASLCGPPLQPIPSSVSEHLRTCPQCRGEAQEICHLDSILSGGFSSWEACVGQPSDELVASTLARVQEEAPEATLFRRLRRSTRLLLWGLFYAFTLLASMILAVALYRAVRGL